MGTHIALILVVLAAPSILADSYYMNGNLEHLHSTDNYTTCSFSIGGKSSPSNVNDKLLCNFLRRAHEHNTPVSVTVYTGDKYTYAAHFHNRNAAWAGKKLESASFTYELVGNVEDVYYSKNCYIAIDTGYEIRNNKVFHVTSDPYTCEKAIDAFYNHQTVVMLASVDTTTDYSNNVEKFFTTNWSLNDVKAAESNLTAEKNE